MHGGTAGANGRDEHVLVGMLDGSLYALPAHACHSFTGLMDALPGDDASSQVPHRHPTLSALACSVPDAFLACMQCCPSDVLPLSSQRVREIPTDSLMYCIFF
jgi:hypothetical protein